MSERGDREYLVDIEQATQRIADYIAGMKQEAFLQDTKTQDAVIGNLEIIGEATKKVSSKLRAAYPTIPWKGMAGLRDRLIHAYFGVNLDIVWQIITAELPDVATTLNDILRDT